MKNTIIVNSDLTYHPCPKCGKRGTIRKSKTRSLAEYIYKEAFFFNYYRCRDCGWRGKRFSKTIRRKSLTSLFAYLFLGVVFAVICWVVLLKVFH